MCVLRMTSDTLSFKELQPKIDLNPYSVDNKGDLDTLNSPYKTNIIQFEISNKSWDDNEGQIKDTVEFLSKYFDDLQFIMNQSSDIKAVLDFPFYSRIDDKIAIYSINFPTPLVSIAGKLNLSIEVSTYSRDF